MNKKILIVSILAVFTLVAISFASAVSTQTANTTKKESPLFGVRTRRAIGDRLKELKENIKAKYVCERLVFLPFLARGQSLSIRHRLGEKITCGPTICSSGGATCPGYMQTCCDHCDEENILVRDRLAIKTWVSPRIPCG